MGTAPKWPAIAMNLVKELKDVNGYPLAKGDVVRPLSGLDSGRVCKMAVEDDVSFVCVRPMHQTVGPGVWHAADQVVWVAPASRHRA